MSHNIAVIGLDVGTRRIGIAVYDGSVRIARPLVTLEVDGEEMKKIMDYVTSERAGMIVVGYPRNQSGESTEQTQLVEAFVDSMRKSTSIPVVFQDESLTSVLAEDRLKARGRAYSKADIDAEAATLILQDYIERNV